jgi:hypothetical protein
MPLIFLVPATKQTMRGRCIELVLDGFFFFADFC